MLAVNGSVFTSFNARFPNPVDPDLVSTARGYGLFSPPSGDYMPGVYTAVGVAVGHMGDPSW